MPRELSLKIISREASKKKKRGNMPLETFLQFQIFSTFSINDHVDSSVLSCNTLKFRACLVWISPLTKLRGPLVSEDKVLGSKTLHVWSSFCHTRQHQLPGNANMTEALCSFLLYHSFLPYDTLFRICEMKSLSFWSDLKDVLKVKQNIWT